MPAPSRSRPGDAAPGPDLAPLSVPFGESDLDWTVVEVSDARDEVRIVPRPSDRALRARLDAVAGVRGWSVRFDAMPGDAVACHLELDGVTKGFVAPAALVGGGAETASVAWAGAAGLWGACPAWPDGASAWVACDPETLRPLEVPAMPSPWGLEAGTAAHAPAVPAAAGDGAPTPDAPHAADAPHAPDAPSAGGAPSTPAADPKPEAQQLIDRLIDRLKAEGKGLEAARVLVRHNNGYGSDPQAARELYTELRRLLLTGAAAEATP